MAWVTCAATSRLPAADPGVAQLTQGHGTFLDLLPKIALGKHFLLSYVSGKFSKSRDRNVYFLVHFMV